MDTDFWSDVYIETLNANEKLLYIFLITNPNFHLSGVYQITVSIISAYTRIEKDEIIEALKKLEADNKVLYFDGWIAIKNKSKYWGKLGDDLAVNVFNQLEKSPLKIKEFIEYEILCAEYKDTLKSVKRGSLDPINKDKDKDKDKKEGKKEKTYAPDTAPGLCQYFYKRIFELKQKEYVPNWTDETGIMANILKTLKPETIREKIDLFLLSEDNFIKKAGFTINIFRGQINKLGAEKPKMHLNLPPGAHL